MASENSNVKIVTYNSSIAIYSKPLYVQGYIVASPDERESVFNSGLKITNGKSLVLIGDGGKIDAKTAIITGKELHAKNGRTKTYTVKVGLKESIDLQFTDGILVGAFNSDGSSIADSNKKSNLTADETKHIVSSLHNLTSGAIGSDRLGKLAWADYIKKKFKVTMSGSGSDSSLYVRDSQKDVTLYSGASASVDTVHLWKKENSYTISVDSPGTGWSSVGSCKPDCHIYMTGKHEVKGYKPAGNMSIKLTGTSDEVVLEPSATDPETINITITGATVTM